MGGSVALEAVLVDGYQAGLQQLLYLGSYLGVLEVVLQRLRVLLHLLQDAAHRRVPQDGLHFRIAHCAFADLENYFITLYLQFFLMKLLFLSPQNFSSRAYLTFA